MQTLIADVKKLVDSRLTYATDQDVHGIPEHWRSHASQILASSTYHAQDDCDGFALTYADILVRSGMAPHRVAIAFIDIRNVGGHLACVVDDNIVLDNNFDRPVMKTTLKRLHGYRFISRMTLDQRGSWVEYS